MDAHVLRIGREEVGQEWSAPISSQLDMIERRLEEAVGSDVSAAFELSMHLVSAGGKRVRPALVVLSAFALGGEDREDRAVNLAAAAELMHTASLVHDDVVDETHERRGVVTANESWGNKLSVLGGDFLLANAFRLLAEDGEPEVHRVLSAAAVRMIESEMLQAASEHNLASWQENYWRIIRGKTASFMGACCECGAVAAGAGPEMRQAISQYGVELGLAFQVTDDLLDIAGDPARTGKDIGTDLTHGKFTLPVLLALRTLDGEGRRNLIARLQGRPLPPEEARAIAEMAIERGVVEMARQTAMGFAEKAREKLACVPASEYRAALDSLTSFVIDRTA